MTTSPEAPPPSRLERLNATPPRRLAVTLFIFPLTLIPYQLLNHALPPRFDLLTPLDAALPFWPWTVTVYMSLYALYLAAAVALSPREYLRVLGAMLTLNCLCYVGFIALTAHYPRPGEEAWGASWWAFAFRWMFSMDPPGNTCPSLHVSTATLLGLALHKKREGRADRWLWRPWGALIALSTLTVKQHFVADVASGALLGWWVFEWFERRWGGGGGGR